MHKKFQFNIDYNCDKIKAILPELIRNFYNNKLFCTFYNNHLKTAIINQYVIKEIKKLKTSKTIKINFNH